MKRNCGGGSPEERRGADSTTLQGFADASSGCHVLNMLLHTFITLSLNFLTLSLHFLTFSYTFLNFNYTFINLLQGVFFNWDSPKNHKYGKKLKYLNWNPPKNHKYRKKLKYPNWDPPKLYCNLTFFHT